MTAPELADVWVQEEWRDVVGHEGRHQVSSLGRVRSIPRTIRGLDGRLTRWRGQLLGGSKAWQYESGKWHYAEVALSHRERARVHVLVLTAFHGPRPAGLIARHLNGNGSDNRASNLRWGTSSENMIDRNGHGRTPQLLRDRCPSGHTLASPNLRASLPYRACLACQRAATAAGAAKRAGAEFDRKAYADAAYLRITGAERE